jgi:glutamate synthase (NADPH/NADH) small chain
VVEVKWLKDNAGKQSMVEVEGTKHIIPAQLVLLSMGFIHCTHNGLLDDLGCEYDARGNVKINNFQTSVPKVFAAGDTVIGASLVVKAIYSGRQAATAVNKYLNSI